MHKQTKLGHGSVKLENMYYAFSGENDTNFYLLGNLKLILSIKLQWN